MEEVHLIRIEHFRSGQVFLEYGPINMVIGGWRQGKPLSAELDEAAAVAAHHLEELSRVPDRAGVPYFFWGKEHKNPAVLHLPPVFSYMCAAVKATGDHSLTPMAAVAGAIADLTVEALRSRGATKAFANNGGDIAVQVGQGEKIVIGIVSSLATGKITHTLTLTSREYIGGIATSGLGGRGFTKGVADAVVVLAGNARLADACATLIANATLIETPEVLQVKAETLDPQTDLVGQMVTKEVQTLPPAMIEKALRGGKEFALRLIKKGLIKGAFIFVQRQMTVVPASLLAKTVQVSK